MQKAREWNFDGLVGPTHHYAGLSHGNMASMKHKAAIASPKRAALQGLAKMKALSDLGVPGAVLPPHARPVIGALRALGFSGDTAAILKKAFDVAPDILAACYSASSMWTANAATVSPSADTEDSRVHFTASNLNSKFHRSLEPDFTARVLQAIFSNDAKFVHHAPLPACPAFGDEGAANHTRFCKSFGEPGLELFAYGRRAWGENREEPKRFVARQTFEASASIARLHGVRHPLFAQQRAKAIDAGVFHNDVISVGHRDLFLCHEEAFVDQGDLEMELKAKFAKHCGGELRILPVPSKEVSLDEAVSSYLFNSQLVDTDSGDMVLVAPKECEQNVAVRRFLETIGGRGIGRVLFLDVKESMQNGGGPACLRLRVVLTESERKAALPSVFFSEDLYQRLTAWVEKHYRDSLSLSELTDPSLPQESESALDELSQILGLGSIYPFQR